MGALMPWQLKCIYLFIGRFREPGRARRAFPITKDTSHRQFPETFYHA